MKIKDYDGAVMQEGDWIGSLNEGKGKHVINNLGKVVEREGKLWIYSHGSEAMDKLRQEDVDAEKLIIIGFPSMTYQEVWNTWGPKKTLT